MLTNAKPTMLTNAGPRVLTNAELEMLTNARPTMLFNARPERSTTLGHAATERNTERNGGFKNFNYIIINFPKPHCVPYCVPCRAHTTANEHVTATSMLMGFVSNLEHNVALATSL